MIGDAISDMLIRLKNGYLARKKIVAVPYSKINEKIAGIFLKNGYLGALSVSNTGSKIENLEMELLYKDKKPVLSDLKRISKPQLRIYVGKTKIPRVLGGRGMVILSTPKGFMTGEKARQMGVGGEIICKVW